MNLSDLKPKNLKMPFKDTDVVFELLNPNSNDYTNTIIDIKPLYKEYSKVTDKLEKDPNVELSKKEEAILKDQSKLKIGYRCIVGWENLEDEGQPLPYNADNLKKVIESVENLDNEISKFYKDYQENLGK